MAEIKVGAYICKGCGLGERLNIAALEGTAKKAGKANVVRSHDFLCSQDGVALIQADINQEGVNRVMIAGCSRRAKTEAFNFDGVSISRANLREGVIWIRPDTADAKETTQDMAQDYVAMSCAEVRRMTPPTANDKAQLNRQVLVVGGGISGMTAALEIARAGYKATLVEKSAALGGWAGKLYRRVADRYPYADPQSNGVAELAAAIQAEPGITVRLNTLVARTDGAPGRFVVALASESGETVEETFGAIVQASGFNRYDLANLPEMGGGALPDVIDQAGLEALAVAANGGAIKRPSDGKEVTSVAFVQCAGQRSEKPGHLPYCSGFCCTTSIKQAMYFKDRNPDVDTVILYTDLRTPGVAGEDFYRSGQRKGVTFTKGVVSGVSQQGRGPVVAFHDEILNEDVNLDVDLVVLATGQVANAGVNIDIPPQADGQPAAGQPVSILNLGYRQGPDLPQLKHGFADSHFICFPYETRRTGIYTAGPVRRPMDIAQAQEDATGAALKAIQALENAGLGRAAHPRSGDLSFPSFRREGCTQCKRCTVECPFGAIDEDEQRYPQFNEARCRRCGTCMGACPVRVISFENYSVETVGQQVKAVEMPDEFSDKPRTRILVLACENDAYPALDMAGQNRIEYSPFVRIIPVRCLGSVNTIWITDALNSGYDGILLMGCQKGDNYQCHFVKGSEMAHYRMSKIGDTLKGMNLEVERVTTYEVAITDIQRIPALLNDYAATIEKIGLNPLKDF